MLRGCWLDRLRLLRTWMLRLRLRWSAWLLCAWCRLARLLLLLLLLLGLHRSARLLLPLGDCRLARLLLRRRLLWLLIPGECCCRRRCRPAKRQPPLLNGRLSSCAGCSSQGELRWGLELGCCCWGGRVPWPHVRGCAEWGRRQGPSTESRQVAALGKSAKRGLHLWLRSNLQAAQQPE